MLIFHQESAQQKADADLYTQTKKADAQQYNQKAEAEAIYYRSTQDADAANYKRAKDAEAALAAREKEAQAMFIMKEREAQAMYVQREKEAEAMYLTKSREAEAAFLVRKKEADGLTELSKVCHSVPSAGLESHVLTIYCVGLRQPRLSDGRPSRLDAIPHAPERHLRTSRSRERKGYSRPQSKDQCLDY